MPQAQGCTTECPKCTGESVQPLQSVLKSPNLSVSAFVTLDFLVLGTRRGKSALHLNELTWIIDGFNELIVDFLFALVIFLDPTQPRPLKGSK